MHSNMKEKDEAAIVKSFFLKKSWKDDWKNMIARKTRDNSNSTHYCFACDEEGRRQDSWFLALRTVE